MVVDNIRLQLLYNEKVGHNNYVQNRHTVLQAEQGTSVCSTRLTVFHPICGTLLFPILRAEAFYVDIIEYSKTIDVTLFRVTTHELHADADTQHGLFQVANETVQTMSPQVGHQ